jgi:hypothetical protein
MGKLRWQDTIALLLGLWIAASPWVLGFDAARGIPTWNAVVVGVLIALLAAVDLDAPAKWEEGAMIALGAWTMLSAPVLGFTGDRDATMSMFWSGLVVVVLAGWELITAVRATRAAEHAHGH